MGLSEWPKEEKRKPEPVSANKIDQWTDQDLREGLREVDEGPGKLTRWEVKFIENLLFQYEGPLSTAQRAISWRICKDYEDA